jgi:transposase-like protein
MGKGRTKGALGVDTPTKAQISRDYQAGGGTKTRGAASAVARKHGLGTNGPTQVKKWDVEIRDGIASRANRRSSGRPKGLTPEVKQNIEDVFREEDTQTYREAAEKLGVPKSTLHDYATIDLDYREDSD